jgi:hypothetical protein
MKGRLIFSFVPTAGALVLAGTFFARSSDRSPAIRSFRRESVGPKPSWLFLVITMITFFLQRFQAIQEELYCLEIFGQAYRQYMTRTPRWLGVPR